MTDPQPITDDLALLPQNDDGRHHPDLLPMLTGRKFNYETGELKEIKGYHDNVYKILACDPRWAGRIWLNVMSDRVYVETEHGSRPLTNAGRVTVLMWLAEVYQCRPSALALRDGILAVAAQNRRHPVREYLASLKWDGQERLSTWLSRYLHVDDTPLHRAYARNTLVSAVARVMDPGCKVDQVLTLRGAQRKGKSKAIASLVPDRTWFTDAALSMRDKKDAMEKISGPWIVEIGEMGGMRKADQNDVKAFITTQVDRWRAAYAEIVEDRPRQCIFVASSNDWDVLKGDPSGYRRWCVVTLPDDKAADVTGIIRDRDQLWAEALQAWTDGEEWWLDDHLAAEQAEANKLFQQEDIWEEYVRQALQTSVDAGRVKLNDVDQAIREQQEIRKDTWITHHITRVLSAMGYVKRRSGSERWWERPDVH